MGSSSLSSAKKEQQMEEKPSSLLNEIFKYIDMAFPLSQNEEDNVERRELLWKAEGYKNKIGKTQLSPKQIKDLIGLRDMLREKTQDAQRKSFCSLGSS